MATLFHRLDRVRPDPRGFRSKIEVLERRVRTAMDERQARAAARVRELARALHAVSPDRTLERGYAIVYRDGGIVRDAREVAPGDSISARLARGRLAATVTSADPDPD